MNYKKIYLFLIFVVVVVHSILGQTINIKSEDCEKGKIRIKLKKEQLISVNSSLKSSPTAIGGSSIGVEGIDRISQKVGIKRIKRVFPFSLKNEVKHRKYGLHLWIELEFDEGVDPLSVVEQYKGLEELEIVKPVYKKVQIDADEKSTPYKVEVLSKGKATLKSSSSESYNAFFNDPLLADQWHYENDGRIGENGLDIDLFEAWEQTTGSSDIIVAIVDQGVDIDHEDLVDNIWNNEAEINGEEGVDDDQNGYIDDFHGYNFRMDGAILAGDHGTHVAGTVGAVSNNGTGVAGVAGGNGKGNGVKMISCQVFDGRANGGSNFASAIIYGADNGAVISQNSWGYNGNNYYEPEVYEAIKYFIAEAGQYEGSPMKGGIVIFAAGNTGTDIMRYPGAFDEVISVASISADGFPAPYSTFGDWVDIGALGGDQSNFGVEGGVLSTLPDDKYGYMEGTSMACPHVSGVAALVISKMDGKDLLADDLKRILLNSSNRFIFQHNNKYGTGLLNATNALADDNRIPPVAIDDLREADIFHDEVRLEWTVPVDEDNGEPRYYYLCIGQNEITEQNFDNNALFLLENELKAGETFNINIAGFQKLTNYWFAVKSVDRFENLSDISNVLKVTTSNLPHFMESTRSIEVNIDVTQEAIKKVPIGLSNIGDGIIYYKTKVNNETYYWEQEEVETLTATIKAKSEEASVNPALFESTRSFIKPLSGLKSAATVPVELEHWKNDNTEWVSGMSYQNDNPPNILMGSGNSNAGLVMATRFDIPHDYTFNLTHLELALLPEMNDKPIIVELKKGSKWVQESETVYLQEFYPDTTNVLKYFRVPLYRPQRFEDNEIFWVVLHFPKEMSYPLAMQFGEAEFGYFVMSQDNGNSFKDASYYIKRPIIPMISALSSGEDGAFVFMDPNAGEIHKGQTVGAKVIMDATNLTNGKHLASLGIITNDIHKPIVNIEVKVEVDGQKPEVDTDKTYSFKTYVNEENTLELDISNIGLADLEIYDVISLSPGITKGFMDTLRISPVFDRLVPFNYTPSAIGLVESQVKLVTNIGEISLATEFRVVDQPVLNISGSNTINVVYGETAEIDLTLNNTGSGTNLEYDLEHYGTLSISKGKIPSKLSYNMLTSADSNGPADNTWDDITAYAQIIPYDSVRFENFKLNMSFPFFNELTDVAYATQVGRLFFYYDGFLANNPEAEFDGHGKGVLVPLKINNHFFKLQNLYQYSFGDRSVFTFKLGIIELGGSVRSVGDIEYQVVLFRDGAIEYRYKNVDYLQSTNDYTVALQGLAKEDLMVYKDYAETGKDLYNGKVIRFEPDNDLSMIVSTSSTKGIVPAGESVDVQLTVDPAYYKRTEGLYLNDVIIKTNTVDKEVLYPITINVTGTPEFTVLTDTIDLGTVHLGYDAFGFIEIHNFGSAIGSVSSVSVDDPGFIVEEVMPLEVNAQSKHILEVRYNPSSVSETMSKLNISFSDGTQTSVVLKGKCVQDPAYELNLTTPISVNIQGGERIKVPFSIHNSDNGAYLDYAFKNGWTSWVETEDQQLNGQDNAAQISEYGYWWNVTDENRPFNKWEDISKEADTLLIEQDNQKLIELPFQFPFYGELYNTIWVSKNGYVTVVEPESDHVSTDFAKNDGLRGMIAPFWSRLITTQEGEGVKLKLEDERVILQWDDFIVENNPGSATFQLELLKDGSIYFNYKNVEGWTYSLNYGLESPDESEVLNTEKSWIIDWTILYDGCSIVFNPPSKGTVQSGELKDLDLVLSAERIYKPGVYKDTIELYTNSKAQVLVQIPLQLNVSGSPVLKTLQSIDMGDVIFKENLKLYEKVELLNTGYETLIIDQVVNNQLEDLILYDEKGDKIVKTSSGVLFEAIEIAPWKSYLIGVEIPVSAQEDVSGSISWMGNIETVNQEVMAKIVDSPVFSWTATDQEYSLINTQTQEYQFTISNNGDTTLEYELAPAVVPTGGDVELPIIIEEDGYYTKNYPITVDSLSLDSKQNADGVLTPFVGGIDLAFSNKFVAPEGGFFLTHIKTYTSLEAINEYVKVMVYVGGDDPQAGEKIFEQKFLIEEIVDEEWVFFPLAQPITIPEGEEFYIIMTHPLAYKYMGYDNVSDESVYENSFQGVYRQDGIFSWNSHTVYNYTKFVWKLRPLTAAAEDSWIELDQNSGKLNAGESAEIKATINPTLAGKGEHSAIVIASSNDINSSKNEFKVSLNVNGAPEFKYYPNIYKDTLSITETEDILLNYLFEDPENGTMTFAMDVDNKGPNVKYSQTGNTTAQVKIKTDYNDEGIYSYPVQVTDGAGSFSTDTIVINVLDKNRPAVLNDDYASIVLNLADPTAFTIDPSDLFTDPDGDELEIMAGNYTPEIVDLSLGTTYINLNPITAGTALLVFAADDGKENGFVIYGVYVQVIDDPDAVNSSLDGNGNIEDEEYSTVQKLTIYPNPVIDQISTVLIHLNEDADARVEIFDAVGRMLNVIQETNLNGGVHQYQVDFTTFGSGLYICKYLVNGKFIESKKVIVR